MTDAVIAADADAAGTAEAAARGRADVGNAEALLIFVRSVAFVSLLGALMQMFPGVTGALAWGFAEGVLGYDGGSVQVLAATTAGVCAPVAGYAGYWAVRNAGRVHAAQMQPGMATSFVVHNLLIDAADGGWLPGFVSAPQGGVIGGMFGLLP